MKKLLKKHFGHDTFRSVQEKVIKCFLSGNDAVVVMPTGGGKSLCFQLPALMRDGVTVVISPLISLMKDQVDALLANGIAATMLNSSIEKKELQKRMHDAEKGKYKLIYIAPERLASPYVSEWLGKIKVTALAVDEAHCISQWGHDFRPDYRNLKFFRKRFEGIPVIALSASATQIVRDDIVRELEMNKHQVFVSDFYRENLHLKVISKVNADNKIINLINKHKEESVIVYCFSRKETEQLTKILKAKGINAGSYHAGMAPEKRHDTQEAFVRDKINVVVATIAFGMGIDKPDVRLVIHKTFPKTVEGYYQEIGRAGRDGLSSECVMLYSAGDKIKLDFFLNQMEEDRRSGEEKKIREVMQFAEGRSCRWQWITKYFGQTNLFECGTCDVCLGMADQEDATEIVQKILSAVVRTGNIFGKGHVIKVLRGSKDQNVKSREHHNLSVWGIAKGYSAAELKEYFAHIIARDLLVRNVGEYETFSISQKGIKFLNKQEKIDLPKVQKESILEKRQTQKKESREDFDQEIFAKLRALRKEVADKKRVPAFVIFGDVALQEMAHYLPVTEDEFARISGVGAQKLKRYGKQFTEFIIKLKKEKEEQKIKSVRSGAKQERINSVQKLIGQKKTLEEITRKLSLSKNTIVGYIEEIIEDEKDLRIEYLLLSKKAQNEIKKAVKKNKTGKLRPIFEECEGRYSYEEIRLVVMNSRSLKQSDSF
ncbi:DNA helicase RecQ [bacterium]|jgi:ATP-dependent DNA helicase RecQ|nr:DNA helicase RecQ [bacterium]MBT4251070.1 DNA helicase RecQ [bacterium]MBT4597912.1 DNA helicase RecQ [bacterium]MBT6753896.1 DNA helicase RecQ [bacterium]MBT7037326.1 DNA helicase RecQ [bacterium]